jgi:sugar lactone lactonase YvrE
MANNKAFKVKNGIQAGRYLLSNGTETEESTTYYLDSSVQYNGVSFSVAAEDTNPAAVKFSTDGIYMYVIGDTSNDINQYTLSTAWDISTASYTRVFSVSSQDLTPAALFFKPDGTVMYMVGGDSDTVHQYSLSTAWNLSTASYGSVSFSVASQATLPTGVYIKSDGTKMYILDDTTVTVYQYSLSTAWDVSTASYDSVSLSVDASLGGVRTVEFKPDGSVLYYLYTNYGRVRQYSLSTPWDISTGSLLTDYLRTGSEESNRRGFTINDDGSKFYMVGSTNDSVHEYSTVAYTQTLDLSTGTTFAFTPSGATTVSFTNPPASGLACAFTVEINGDGSAVTWPASVKWHEATTPTATATKELYTFITTDGGTTYYGRKAAEDLQ